MQLLILGYSSIVRRRVLPAANAIGVFSRISVASRHHGPAKAGHYAPSADAGHPAGEDGRPEDVTWFTDYEQALRASGADVAYVSGVNSMHVAWATRALEHGLHVIVDKPAFPDVESAEQLVALARQRQRALAEATVFAFHPQMTELRSLMSDADATRVTMTFSIPPLPDDDFRYRSDSGGGSLYDLGPYVVATSRVLFGAVPTAVHCDVLTTRGSPEVDTSFGVMLTHDARGVLAGHCGFETVYQNRLSAVTRTRAIDVERIFSTPPDFPPTLTVLEAGAARVVHVPAADAFGVFLGAFCDAIARNDFDAFLSALLEDARLLRRLRLAAGRM